MLVEPWAAGHFGLPGEDGERIAYGQCWLANEAGDNPYARPIANLHPVIDLRRRRVLRIDDFGVVPLPPDSGPIRLAGGTANRPAAARNPAARGSELHRPRSSGRLAEMALPRRLQCPRGTGSSTTSATRTASGCARSCTARRSWKWWCPTAIRGAAAFAATPSISANTASARSPIRSASAATASATSTISTSPPTTGTANRWPSATPSACTKKTRGSCGSSGNGASRRRRSAPAPAGSRFRHSRPSATMSTACSGISTRTAPSPSRSRRPASRCRAATPRGVVRSGAASWPIASRAAYTSTSSPSASTWRSTAPGTPCARSTANPCRSVPTTRTATPSAPSRHRWRASRRRSAT